ncbi:unnamed protein product [Darwinula stevensoni]|uniref:Uncharacterized protein n=1 Tax=Darwinula stevensoni TaxID=69355 RepID=A0A7R8WZJ6_9CRUS|nr:unnamed protein product [Darwinula stevensoni]CAG0880089.1 unnamed protein product [Darwinula stevensoni]
MTALRYLRKIDAVCGTLNPKLWTEEEENRLSRQWHDPLQLTLSSDVVDFNLIPSLPLCDKRVLKDPTAFDQEWKRTPELLNCMTGKPLSEWLPEDRKRRSQQLQTWLQSRTSDSNVETLPIYDHRPKNKKFMKGRTLPTPLKYFSEKVEGPSLEQTQESHQRRGSHANCRELACFLLQCLLPLLLLLPPFLVVISQIPEWENLLSENWLISLQSHTQSHFSVTNPVPTVKINSKPSNPETGSILVKQLYTTTTDPLQFWGVPQKPVQEVFIHHWQTKGKMQLPRTKSFPRQDFAPLYDGTTSLPDMQPRPYEGLPALITKKHPFNSPFMKSWGYVFKHTGEYSKDEMDESYDEAIEPSLPLQSHICPIQGIEEKLLHIQDDE